MSHLSNYRGCEFHRRRLMKNSFHTYTNQTNIQMDTNRIRAFLAVRARDVSSVFVSTKWPKRSDDQNRRPWRRRRRRNEQKGNAWGPQSDKRPQHLERLEKFATLLTVCLLFHNRCFHCCCSCCCCCWHCRLRWQKHNDTTTRTTMAIPDQTTNTMNLGSIQWKSTSFPKSKSLHPTLHPLCWKWLGRACTENESVA